MYPVVRVMREMRRAGRLPALAPGETHVTRTRCWPQDLDTAWELNNGRSLTLFDMARMAVLRRCGVVELMKARGLSVAVAGSAVTYRKRVRLMDRIELHATIVGCDARFTYVDHVLYANGVPAHGLYARMALFDGSGIRPTAELFADRLEPGWRAPLPEPIAAWADSEAHRAWPPAAAAARAAA
ncbi:acyl-CoA thioesterase [Albimonas pacifica]|uniref:Thioesterase-like superfamily protein n=1 Tax=Albimonas pacifica TaxID=1114924 RepID=A0A1I3FJK8_9RHOB|nr:acyl-CoA thioesterase [Albimonas pacifica]SFI11413.1 Thioesterase-like superfamily protein [Albimonas pacifica]